MPKSLRSYSHTFLYFAFFDALKSAFQSKSIWKPRSSSDTYEKYRQAAYYLKRKGYIKISQSSSGQKFMQLTQKGELEMLLAKAWIQTAQKWDGKWRMVIFDIPEEANKERDKLRRLLRMNRFVKLQASVYISPYLLNREAVNYLKETKLMSYIRIIRVEEIDDDKDLRKHFNL